MQKLTITSDGTPRGTKVTTAGGELVPGITRVSVSIRPGALVEADLAVTVPHVEVVAQLMSVQNSVSGETLVPAPMQASNEMLDAMALFAGPGTSRAWLASLYATAMAAGR